jgi:ribonucleoside-diphosphate reductase alpha chain
MLTPNAIKVLEKRYLARDESGNLIETPDDMFRRVAKHAASADALYDNHADLKATEDEFYRIMTHVEFMPNSPTLMNAGRPLGQLSACFVLPVPDSMEGIFDAVKNAALIHKSGGGTGFSFSRLRPKGSTVKSTGGVASGPVSFMKVFNAATEAVKQGGTRRGANMGILRVDHPDIREFITCKQDNDDITNFNISVAITDDFMKAVDSGTFYDLIDPKTKQAVRQENAREIFDMIVDNAWNNGEPGIIFIDRMNRDNVTPEMGMIESTNPCGELPLLPYESCNLGSINLSVMTKESDGRYQIDYDKLKKVVHTAVHFLDNIIDMNRYPIPEIEENTKANRKIGLGVMGFADMLFMLGIPYNSEEGISIARKIMKTIQDSSKDKSHELAKLRGAFPNFKNSTLKDGRLLRNATTTTIAPTGTISIICGASSGIEPLFALSFERNVMDNDRLVEVHPYFTKIMQDKGIYSEQLMWQIASKGTVSNIEIIPAEIKQIFVTAHDITPEYHLRMQAAFQGYTDNAVSKTVNFPKEATREDVAKVFGLAYKTGCKGVTIYRDQSRQSQVLSIRHDEKKANDKDSGSSSAEKPDVPASSISNSASAKVTPRQRPDVTMGITEKVKIGCGNLYITVNYDENGICEVFTNLGRAGGCPSQSEATSRLVSMALRSGIDVEVMVEQLKGIRCHSTLRHKEGLKVLSCPDAIGRVLEKVIKIKNGEKSIMPKLETQDNPAQEKKNSQKVIKNGNCPDCGSTVSHESGCLVCRNCGFSKCG